MSKKIDEMAYDIYFDCSRFDILTKSGCEEIAEVLCKLGYCKTIWHKVINGDLPVEGSVVWCYDGNGYYYCSYANSCFIGRSEIGNKIKVLGIIAWTELPIYEGEE